MLSKAYLSLLKVPNNKPKEHCLDEVKHELPSILSQKKTLWKMVSRIKSLTTIINFGRKMQKMDS